MNLEPIFGEDNEIIGYVDDNGTEWTLSEAEDYFDTTGNYPAEYDDGDDSAWLDSIGHGDDESYGW